MLAQSQDVADRLGRDLTPDEEDRVEPLLDEASVLVEGWLGYTPDPVPDGVRIVVSRMVTRSITSGADSINLSAQTTVVGPYQRQNTFNADATSGGPWLTKADKTVLKRYRHACVQNFKTY